MKKRKILILSANPKGTTALRLDEEVREINDGLNRSKYRDHFEVQQRWATRIKDVRRALLDIEPDIVHFSGHGEEEGLCFEDDDGQSILVPNEALKNLFELFEDSVEAVILNSCYSKNQAQAISQNINFLVGMTKGIGDKAAIEFSIGFYDALGAGKSIPECFKFGKNSLELKDIPEALTPVLIEKNIRDTTKIEKSKVQLILDVDKEQFDVIQQNQVRKILAVVLDINETEINILKVEKGSIKLTIEVPSDKKDKLNEIANTDFENKLLPLFKQIYLMAYNYTHNSEESQDLVQETYLEAYKYLIDNEKPEVRNYRAFMYSILKSIIHSQKSTNRTPTIPITEDHNKLVTVDQEENLSKHMIGDEITIAINNLPIDFRTVILLSDIEGFTYEEISKIIDVPIGTVRSRLFRARNYLKQNLEKMNFVYKGNSENK